MVEKKNDAVATRATDPNQSLAKILNDAMPELRKVAPKYVNLTRMVSLAVEAKMRNPLLAKCSPVSVLNFCKRCAEAGTDRIGAGGMWAVPFWNKKNGTYDMTPMPDWRLIVEKAKKAKAIIHATSEAVYENDEFDYERGLNPGLTHKPALSNRGKLKAVYCVYALPDGTKDFAVMDVSEDIEPIHKRSKAADAGPWVTDYAEMAKKTVVKRAMKIFEGASIELTALIAADNIVNGYAEADLTARIPVSMPTLIEGQAEETQPSNADHQPGVTGEPTQPAQGNTKTVTGMVGAVSVKTSKEGAPKPWKKTGIKIGENWYATFDEKVGAAAIKGATVTIVYKTNEKGYHDIVAMQPVNQPADAPEDAAKPSTIEQISIFRQEQELSEGKLISLLRHDKLLGEFDGLEKLAENKQAEVLAKIGVYASRCK